MSFLIATAALVWQLQVIVTGQVAQASEDLFTKEECLELRDQYRAFVFLRSRGTGLVSFRGNVYSLDDIEIECIRDTKGEI